MFRIFSNSFIEMNNQKVCYSYNIVQWKFLGLHVHSSM